MVEPLLNLSDAPHAVAKHQQLPERSNYYEPHSADTVVGSAPTKKPIMPSTQGTRTPKLLGRHVKDG